MSLSIARPLVMRRSAGAGSRTTIARRFQSSTPSPSSTSSATSKAAEAAKDTASKAAQGLSRVTSAAGPVILGAARGLAGALGKVGGRTGRLAAFVERQVPWVVYYSKVGIELSKIVFRQQQMSPPSVATFQNYFQNLWKQLQKPSALVQTLAARAPPSGQAALQQVRNLPRAQLAAGGVLLAELLGFFTVGEMLGRFKIIGYHGETAHAGGHH